MSLNKIISIKNIGRFQNCSVSGDVSLKCPSGDFM